MKKMKTAVLGIFFSGIIFTVWSDIFSNNQYQKKYSYDFTLRADAEEEITGLKNIKTVNGITEREYTVQKGDNIYKITKKTGQSLTVLLLNNPEMEMDNIAAATAIRQAIGFVMYFIFNLWFDHNILVMGRAALCASQ